MKFINALAFAALFVFAACEKDNNVSVDTNGVWYGTYTHDNSSGIFKTKIAQAGSQCTGRLCVKYDLPSEEGYSMEIFGFINGDKFKSNMTIGPVQINAESLQLSNSDANGVFSTNISISGTWIGQKIPLGNSKISKIALNEPPGFYISGCTSLNNKLWVYSFMDGSFHQIDTTGNDVGHIVYTNVVSNLTTDGTNLWVYSAGEGFTKINPFGTVLNSFELHDAYYSAVLAHNGSLLCFDGTRRYIYKLNYQGQKTDSIAMPYLYISDMEFADGHFYLTESEINAVIQTDEQFNFIKSYTLPEDGYSNGKAIINGSMWYFLNNFGNSGDLSVLLYRIGFD